MKRLYTSTHAMLVESIGRLAAGDNNATALFTKKGFFLALLMLALCSIGAEAKQKTVTFSATSFAGNADKKRPELYDKDANLVIEFTDLTILSSDMRNPLFRMAQLSTMKIIPPSGSRIRRVDVKGIDGQLYCETYPMISNSSEKTAYCESYEAPATELTIEATTNMVNFKEISVTIVDELPIATSADCEVNALQPVPVAFPTDYTGAVSCEASANVRLEQDEQKNTSYWITAVSAGKSALTIRCAADANYAGTTLRRNVTVSRLTLAVNTTAPASPQELGRGGLQLKEGTAEVLVRLFGPDFAASNAGYNERPTWSSNKPDVVTVDPNGNLYAGTTPGKATITATFPETALFTGASGSYDVEWARVGLLLVPNNDREYGVTVWRGEQSLSNGDKINFGEPLTLRYYPRNYYVGPSYEVISDKTTTWTVSPDNEIASEGGALKDIEKWTTYLTYRNNWQELDGDVTYHGVMSGYQVWMPNGQSNSGSAFFEASVYNLSTDSTTVSFDWSIDKRSRDSGNFAISFDVDKVTQKQRDFYDDTTPYEPGSDKPAIYTETVKIAPGAHKLRWTFYQSSWKFDSRIADVYGYLGNIRPAASMDGIASVVPPRPVTLTANQSCTEIYIDSRDDWNKFASAASTGNYILRASLDSVETMAGSPSRPFAGTFDGRGHTIDATYTTTSDTVGVFRYVKGATLRNITAKGTITTNRKYAGGLVGAVIGEAADKTTIEGCTSMVNILATIKGDATHGGIVGYSRGITEVNNCLFAGSITGGRETTSVGGLVGFALRPATISNSLVFADINVKKAANGNFDNSATLVRHADSATPTISNSYYLGTIAMKETQGEAASTEKIRSGETAWRLQGKQETQAWGQRLGTQDADQHPLPTADADRRVIGNTYDDGTAIYDNYMVITDGKGNTANIEAKNRSQVRVKLMRTFDSKHWNTLVLPFDMTHEQVENSFGSNVRIARFTNSTEDIIDMNTDNDKSIRANEPILIRIDSKKVAESDNQYILGSCTITSASAAVKGEQGIDFIGNYAASYTLKEGEYFIADDKLLQSQGNNTIGATSAYFSLSETSMAKAPTMRIDGDDVTVVTGIDSVEYVKKEHRSTAVYTLSGQKVADSLDSNRLPAGIYIVNGKKIIVR